MSQAMSGTRRIYSKQRKINEWRSLENGCYLLIELHPTLIGRFGSKLPELLDWLSKRGYVGFDGRDIRINNAKVARSGWIQRLYFLPLNPSN
jgi:hypothetical protein